MLINVFAVLAYSSNPPTGKKKRQKKKEREKEIQQLLQHLTLPWVLEIYMQEYTDCRNSHSLASVISADRDEHEQFFSCPK